MYALLIKTPDYTNIKFNNSDMSKMFDEEVEEALEEKFEEVKVITLIEIKGEGNLQIDCFGSAGSDGIIVIKSWEEGE